jgi:hypothetical protein
MFTTTRTPFIIVPIDQLSLGMKVVKQDGSIGAIDEISADLVGWELSVQFDDGDSSYYSREGFLREDGDTIYELKLGIKLFDNKPDTFGANIEQTDISNKGLTAEELDTVNALVNNRGMTRAAAIMMIIQ